MLTAAAFSVVVVANGNPLHALGLVLPSNLRYGLNLLTRELILPGAGLVGERVDRAKEHVVAQVIQVSPEPQPCSSRRYVVSGALAGSFDQHWHVNEIVAVPCRPWLQNLQSGAAWVNVHIDATTVFGRGNVAVNSDVEAVWRNFRCRFGWHKHELIAVGVCERISYWVEAETATQSHGHS